MPTGIDAVLVGLEAVQRASVLGFSAALGAVTEAVRAIVGDGREVSCIGFDPQAMDAPGGPPQRPQILAIAWSGAVEVAPCGRDQQLVTVLPVLTRLPGATEARALFPIAAVLIDATRAPGLEADTLEALRRLTGLVGETLMLSLDSLGRKTHDGVIAAHAFRRLVARWGLTSRARKEPVSLLVIGLHGVEALNQRLGFDAGDRTVAEAVRFYAARLPANAVLSAIGGATTGALLPQVGVDEACTVARGLVEAYAAGPAAALPSTVSASIGVASAGADLPDVELLRGARLAMVEARHRGDAVVVWTPGLRSDDDNPLPDIDSLSGLEYQRVRAIWRLYEAMSQGLDRDGLIASALRSALPLYRAERVSFWELEDGKWQRRHSVARNADETGAEVGLAVPKIVTLAAAGSDVVIDGDPDQPRALALAVPRPNDGLCVIEIAHQSGGLFSAQENLQFLRTFGRQLGRILGEIEAIEQSRRQQQETAARLRKQAIELRRLVRTSSGSGLIGSHPSMQSVFRLIEGSRTSHFPVIIAGETGTGKEAVARLVHRSSNRHGPFIVVDCGAIPGPLLESELFGHEKGAFTGADARKIGHFEAADKGTIFLDEIGELPLELQPKLLRVLQESTIRRIGGRDMIAVDFRLITATHRDLAAMVEAGTFRQDLYFRLRVLEIKVPPLRDRGDDILLLALHSLQQYCAEIGRDMMTISPDAEAAMREYAWPGNVRELQNVLRRALLVAHGPELVAKDLNLDLGKAPRPSTKRLDLGAIERPPPAAAPEPAAVLEDAVRHWLWHVWAKQTGDVPPPQDVIEAFLLRTCLTRTGGSIAEAAKMLDIHPETFSSHLDKLADPGLSRTIRTDPLASMLERGLDGEDRAALQDRVLRVVLSELLVFCRGNKTDMARRLGWGRQTLARHLQRLGVVGTT